jgi:putative tricarboxylic transport membrane protein
MHVHTNTPTLRYSNTPIDTVHCTMSPVVIARVSGLVVAGIGVAACILARSLPAQTGFGLGPAFLPFWTGIVLVACGLWLCAWGVVDTEVSWPSLPAFARAASGFGLLLLYALTLQPVGYLISTALFLMIAILMFEPVRPTRAFMVGIVSAAFLFFIFRVWLRVPLPGGVLSW